MGTITFDSRNLFQNFGVIVGSGSSFGAPESDVDVEPIPGRNGDLIIDNGRYKNRRATYNAFIYRNAAANVAALRSFLASHGAGYYKLADSYDQNHFVMARYSGPVDVEMRNLNRVAELNLTFDCKPQRFLTSGDAYISKIVTEPDTEVTLVNPTNFDAKPILYVKKQSAADTMVVNVNGQVFTILPSSGRTEFYVDCETMNVYYSSENRNKYFAGEFPELVPGENKISFTGSSGSEAYLSIRPRWWEL